MPSQEDYLDKLLQNVGDDAVSENEEFLGVSEVPDMLPDAEGLQESAGTLPVDTMADLEAALGPDGDLDVNSLLELPDEPVPEIEYMPDPAAESGEADELLEDAVADLEAALDSEETLGTDVDGYIEAELEEAVIADLETADVEADESVLEETVVEMPSMEELLQDVAEEPTAEEFEESAMAELEDAAVEAVGEPALGEAAIEESDEAAAEGLSVEDFTEAAMAELEGAAIEPADEPALEETAIEEAAVEEPDEAAADESSMEDFAEAAMAELEGAAIEPADEPALEETVIEDTDGAAAEEPSVADFTEDVIEELQDAAIEAVDESALEEAAIGELEEAVTEEAEIEKPVIEEPIEFDLNKMVESLDETIEADMLEEMASLSKEPESQEMLKEPVLAELPEEEQGIESISEPTYEEETDSSGDSDIEIGDLKQEAGEEIQEEPALADVQDFGTDDGGEISLDDLLAQEAEAARAETEEAVPDEESGGLETLTGEDALDLDAVSSMSEDEIDKLLAAGAQEGNGTEAAAEEDPGETDLPDDEDVLSMLDDTDDSELQEIQDMLQKADNNEAVDEEIEALLQGPAEEENLAEKLFAEDDGEQPGQADTKDQKVQDKKLKRQEKAAAKKAAKEAKAAAKKAAKEAKAAAKEANAAAKAGAAAAGVGAAAAAGAALTEDTERETGVDDMFDTSVLDSIVSEADQAGLNDGQSASGEEEKMADTDLLGDEDDLLGGMDDLLGGEDDFPGGADFLAGLGDIDTDVSGQETPETVNAAQDNGSAAGDDNMDFDMGSLFGNDAVDNSTSAESDAVGGIGEAQRSDSDFPDFVPLDGDNVDSIMPEEAAEGQKKKGLFARLIDFLTEEDEEDEESSSLQLSDENKDILNQLDNEKTSGKKKKKKKGDDGEEGKGKKEKAAKPKKEKKPKPEKPKKEPEPGPLIPERKLTLKRILPVVLVCLSLAVLIIVFTNATVDYNSRKDARNAYYDGDYQTCFQNLYGKENLSETEQIMFGTSESILRMQLWLSEYEMLVEEGSEVEALDCLIQSVNDYPELYAYAAQWNAEDEVMAGYNVILYILNDKYGLTEEQALEIAAVHSDREYTRRVVMIVLGGAYGSWDGSASVTPSQEAEPTPLPDELPEEGELENNSFIDNQ